MSLIEIALPTDAVVVLVAVLKYGPTWVRLAWEFQDRRAKRRRLAYEVGSVRFPGDARE